MARDKDVGKHEQLGKGERLPAAWIWAFAAHREYNTKVFESRHGSRKNSSPDAADAAVTVDGIPRYCTNAVRFFPFAPVSNRSAHLGMKAPRLLQFLSPC